MTTIQKQGSKSMFMEKKENINKYGNKDLKNKSSLLDISYEDANDDILSSNRLNNKSKFTSSTRLKPSMQQLSGMNSPRTNQTDSVQSQKPSFPKALLDDFKKYIEYRQNKKNLMKSMDGIPTGGFDQINQFGKQNMSQQNNNSQTSENGESDYYSKLDYHMKVQKHKEQTKKIAYEINKKLKIQGKSKAEKFEDQMQVFKNTDTYIEIKPFLQQLNKVNNQKFIDQITKYQNNIKLAQQYQNQDAFLKNSKYYGINRQRNEEESMRKFEDLIAKANQTIIQQGNVNSTNLLQSNIIEGLMIELGYVDPNIQQLNDDVIQNNSTPATVQQLSNEQKPNKKNTESKLSQNQKQIELPQIKRKPSIQIGDLPNDENQFFVNLKEYLNRAQKDINLKLELETELNTYADIIEENQRKMDEAKQQQAKKLMNGKLDPANFFEGDKDMELKEYHQRFIEKAEQVRKTLHKKWANAQMKRKMQRQKERNVLLSQFKNNKEDKNEDILNPSKRMNERLLRNRQIRNSISHDHFARGSTLQQSKELRSSQVLNESDENLNSSTHRSRSSNKNIDQQDDEQSIYLTQNNHSQPTNQTPVQYQPTNQTPVSQQPTNQAPIQQQQANPKNPIQQYQFSEKYQDPSAANKDKKLKQINDKINRNSINLPLISSNKSFQSSNVLSPQRKSELLSILPQSTKNQYKDPNSPYLFNSVSFSNSSNQINTPSQFKSLSGNMTPQYFVNSNSQTPIFSQNKKNSIYKNQRNSSFDPNALKKNTHFNDQRQSIQGQKSQSQFADDEQQKIEQLIQEIDEEHNEYIQEKNTIKNQLELISENFDKDMFKYSKNQNIDSIRGISQDIPQHNYHSGSKLYSNKYNKQNRV